MAQGIKQQVFNGLAINSLPSFFSVFVICSYVCVRERERWGRLLLSNSPCDEWASCRKLDLFMARDWCDCPYHRAPLHFTLAVNWSWPPDSSTLLLHPLLQGPPVGFRLDTATFCTTVDHSIDYRGGGVLTSSSCCRLPKHPP